MAMQGKTVGDTEVKAAAAMCGGRDDGCKRSYVVREDDDAREDGEVTTEVKTREIW